MKTSTLAGLLALNCVLWPQTKSPAEYQIYAGSTHAHTAYTWSHGEHLAKSDCAGILVFSHDPAAPFAWKWSGGYVKSKTGCSGIYVIDGAQIPSPDMPVKPDWQKFQGPPSVHFAQAKANGYDFYTTADHSQEAGFQPPSPTNAAWVESKKEAAAATDASFVALAGFEYSENDGATGTGHINVINTDGMLNALVPGIDLPQLYKWLATARPNGGGAVVASFNHPGPEQYHNWDYRDPQVTDVITMLEVINSNNKIHDKAFVNALDKGWKVSPVCGNDNHGLTGIAKHTSRTFVLAKSRTREAILDAMKNRRTYASLDKSLQCRYTVNGAIMGSTLRRPEALQFDIAISGKDKITKIDIVKDHGEVVEEYKPEPGSSLHWSPAVKDSSSKYFFVRVWTARGGDAPGADPAKPVAWLAPVWTGR
jgi:hypothetical protein